MPNKEVKLNTSMLYIAFYVTNMYFYAIYGILYSLKCEYQSNPKRRTYNRSELMRSDRQRL